MAKRRGSGFWDGAERVAGRIGRVFGALRGISNIPSPSLTSFFAEDHTEHDDGEEILTAHAAVATIPTVYGCVDLLKTNVAKYPLRFYLGDPGGKRTEVLAEKGNIVQLFNSPNAIDTGFIFIEKIAASLDVAGNAYILLEQIGTLVVAMWVLPAHRVEIIPGPNFGAKEYRLHYGGKIIPYQPDQIVHIRYWSPVPGPLGMAPMSPASISYRTQRLSNRWMHSLYLRGGETAGVYLAERPVANAKRERLELKIKQRHQGPEGTGRMLILPPGMKRENTMLTPEQMKLIEATKLTKTDIYEVFGIPPWMKGLKEGASLGQQGAEVDERLFTDNAVEPRCMRIAGGITYLLLRFIEPALHCEFDLSRAHSRRKVMIELIKAGKDATGVACVSVNEWRTGVLGLEPLADAKYDLPPDTPLPSDNAPTGSNADNVNRQSDATRRLLEGARAPQVTEEARAKIDAELARFERLVHAAWVQLFDEQEGRVLVAAGGERAAGESTEQDLINALAATADERAYIVSVFHFILETQGAEALAALEYKLGLKLTFDMDRAGAAEFIRRHVDRALTETTDTTRERLRERIAQVTADGGGLTEITAAVRDVFEGRRANALTIARTETAPAFNFATVSAWQQSGVVETKTWVTVHDGRARIAHLDADGQTVGINERFRVGGELLLFPGDPSQASAGNTINCRCGMLAGVVSEEDGAPSASLREWFARALPSSNGHGRIHNNRLREFLSNGS